MTPFDSDTRDFRDYLEVIRRRWRIVVTCALIGGVLAAAYSVRQPNVYESSAVLLFQSATSSGLVRKGLVGSDLTQAAAAQVEVQLFDSQVVQDRAAAALGESANVKAVILDEAIGLEIIASAASPDQAARAANVYAQAYADERVRSSVEDAKAARTVLRDQLSELDGRIDAVQAELKASASTDGEGSTDSALTEQLASLSAQRIALEERLDAMELIGAADGPQMVKPAEPNSSPTAPKPLRNVAAGVSAGLVIGLALAFARDRFDEVVRTEDELRDIVGDLPVLATIPHIKKRGDEFISIIEPSAQTMVEPLRTIRMALQYIGVDRPLSRLLIVSPTPGDGKSTLSLNLALAFGRAGQRTVLVDADLRRPRLSSFVDNPLGVGLTTVLSGATLLENSVMRLQSEPNLALLATGPPPLGSWEVFEEARTREVLESISSQADIVLYDAPPLLTVADGLTLTRMADAVVIVVRAGRTRERDIRVALGRLEQVGAAMVGCVLNDKNKREAHHAYYYDGYGTSSAETKAPPLP